MTFGTEFWSAIIGAVVGGVIALAVQLIAINASKKERIADKNDKRQALGHSIIFKTMRIYSNLNTLHKSLEDSFMRVAPSKHDEPWSFVLPLANTPDDVHYSADEMSLVLSFNNPDLTEMLMSLGLIHNSLIDIFETYREYRYEITSLMPAEMDGNVGQTILTNEQIKIVRPKMVAVNQLIADMRIRAKKDCEESRDAVKQFLATANDELGLKLKVEFKAGELAKGTQ